MQILKNMDIVYKMEYNNEILNEIKKNKIDIKKIKIKPLINKQKLDEYEEDLIKEWRKSCIYMRYRDEKINNLKHNETSNFVSKNNENIQFQLNESSIDLFVNYAYRGKINKLKLFIEEKNYPINCRNIRGMTALYCSCINGQFECVKYLLECNANVYIKDIENERTPLHAACTGGNTNNHLECIELLVKEYPDLINIKDKYGMTPIIAAGQLKYTKIIEKLILLGGNLNERDYVFIYYNIIFNDDSFEVRLK